MIDGILGPGGVPPIEAFQNARVEKLERVRHYSDVRKAAQEYESYFLAYLMKIMRSTVPQGSLTSNPMGETFYSFYDEEIAKRAAQSGGVGLADFVLSSLAQESSKVADTAHQEFLEKHE